MKELFDTKEMGKKKQLNQPGTDEVLRKRYEDLYGEGGYEEKYAAEKKRIRKDYILVCIVFLITVSLSAYGMMTSSEGLTEKDGVITEIERPEKGGSAALYDVRITAGKDKARVTDEKQIRIDPEGSGADEEEDGRSVLGEETGEEKLMRAIDTAVRTLNADTESAKVILPTELEDGTKLAWQREPRNDILLILVGMAVILFAVRRSRFTVIAKEEREARDSVIRDMPGFMNKLLLLLRGGLVLGEAMERISFDAKMAGTNGKSYFYRQLCDISDRVSQTNGVLHEELADFAKRSGVRELMRFSNMVKENVEKGSDLTDKLEQESRMLWFLRKKHSEEAGRLAETKLTFPLVILILVLIVVTTAPALMQM